MFMVRQFLKKKIFEVLDAEPEVKIVEIPVEVEKEVMVEKYIKLPDELRGPLNEAAKHARRQGANIPINLSKFFD